ncbi:hypothetical protein [Thalassobius sp. MITS945101]|uniref:hypothetical protein n=1 Tax=Thalassobius sp. MITS945101 TaxID=3096994 RepID=UPI00399AA6A4
MLTTLPPLFFITAALCVLLTGISKSGFAGGLGVMSVPILSLFVAPQFAGAVLMPILLLMDLWICGSSGITAGIGRPKWLS